MKQISIQITDITARQMQELAREWGLPAKRHNTAVIERAIANVHMLEIGFERYVQRMAEASADVSRHDGKGDRP